MDNDFIKIEYRGMTAEISQQMIDDIKKSHDIDAVEEITKILKEQWLVENGKSINTCA